jgi:hypothetical protein
VLDQLGRVVGQPQAVEGLTVECEDHHGTARHPAQLAESLGSVRPLMDGQRGHGRVKGPLIEPEIFGRGVVRGGEVPWTLGPHRRRGLDGDDVAVLRLARAGARSYVEHRPGTAQRLVDPRRDPGIGAATQRVVMPVEVIVEVAGGRACHAASQAAPAAGLAFAQATMFLESRITSPSSVTSTGTQFCPVSSRTLPRCGVSAWGNGPNP